MTYLAVAVTETAAPVTTKTTAAITITTTTAETTLLTNHQRPMIMLSLRGIDNYNYVFFSVSSPIISPEELNIFTSFIVMACCHGSGTHFSILESVLLFVLTLLFCPAFRMC